MSRNRRGRACGETGRVTLYEGCDHSGSLEIVIHTCCRLTHGGRDEAVQARESDES